MTSGAEIRGGPWTGRRHRTGRWQGALWLLWVAACDSGIEPPPPWRVIHRGSEAVASVDTTRLETDGRVVEAWVRFDYDTPDVLPGDSTRMFNRVDVHTELDCVRETLTDRRMELRDPDGQVLEGSDEPTRWTRFSEHPFGQWVYPAVCRYARERARSP